VNFYPFHVGDYASHTAHLEPLEDLAYRRMLDLYYLREQALPEDVEEIARLIRMRKNVAEIRAVLREFFTNNNGDGWIHMRCEDEIRRMQDKQAKARASAQASVNARSAKAKPTLNERSTNAERPLNEGSATNTNTNTKPPTEVAGPSLRVVPPSPPPDFDGRNAETLNGKSVVPLSAGFELPEAWGFDAEALGFKPDEVLREAEKMRQWATVGKGAGTRRSVKGWRQTWSNWLGKAAERQQR
jgi:uncharacterized protein YdaU (DUF1376 family)